MTEEYQLTPEELAELNQGKENARERQEKALELIQSVEYQNYLKKEGNTNVGTNNEIELLKAKLKNMSFSEKEKFLEETGMFNQDNNAKRFPIKDYVQKTTRSTQHESHQYQNDFDVGKEASAEVQDRLEDLTSDRTTSRNYTPRRNVSKYESFSGDKKPEKQIREVEETETTKESSE